MSSTTELNLTVLFNGDRILTLPPLSPSIDIATIKIILSTEVNTSPANIILLYKQNVLIDSQTLTSIGIQNQEMLQALTNTSSSSSGVTPTVRASTNNTQQPQQPQQQQQQPQAALPPGAGSYAFGMSESTFKNALKARDFIRAVPQLLFSIEAQNPSLYQAIMMNDTSQFERMWSEVVRNVSSQKDRDDELASLENADPMDPVVQSRIAELIRLRNVQENYEMAVEHAPESFGRVIMLYIPMKVHGHDLQAFVDSGAQSTIMSVQCAEKCGIMRLLDTRFAGVAKGVGTARILGRVHQVPCQIGNVHMSMSFTILENQGMDFLLGLDQLKKQLACIDLSKNALIIQGQEIPFLSEKDLPSHARGGGEADEDEPMTSSSTSSSSSTTSSGTTSSAAQAQARSAAAATPATLTPSPIPPVVTSSNVGASRPATIPSSSAAAAVEAALRRVTQATPPAAATTTTSQSTPNRTNVTQTTPVAATGAGGTPSTYTPTQAQISQLTDLGFDAQSARAALTRFNGNVDAAASFLFSM